MRAVRVIVLGSTLAHAACTPPPASVPVPRAATPDPTAVQRLDLAEQAKLDGDHGEALRHLLLSIDSWPSEDRKWVGVWLSTLPESFADLVARHPPALAALQMKLDELDAMMLRGDVPERARVVMYAKLAGVAGQPQRTVQTLDALRAASTSARRMPGYTTTPAGRAETRLAIEVVDEIARQQRDDLLALYADSILAFSIALRARAVDGRHVPDCALVADRGALLYGALLRENDAEHARRLSIRVLDKCPDANAYALIQRAARAAGRADEEARLDESAKSKLSPSAYSEFRDRAAAGGATTAGGGGGLP